MLAHQGGWDEILLVLLPIAIFAGLLAVANRRANRMVGSHRSEGTEDDDGADPGRRGGPSDPPPPAP
ncbi:MAG: hypothetical protein ACO1PW_12390 [Actinomycetota bacterium]